MKRRGFTLLELMVGVSLMTLVLGTFLTLLVASLRSFERTEADVDITEDSALAMYRMVETIREAVSVSISNDGKTLTYELPAKNSTTDPDTGEIELVEPIVSDGVSRSFTVSGDTLVNSTTGNTLVTNILSVDPDPNSSQYNQTYSPFQKTTVGSRNAITINIITGKTVGDFDRYQRFKTTVVLPNAS